MMDKASRKTTSRKTVSLLSALVIGVALAAPLAAQQPASPPVASPPVASPPAASPPVVAPPAATPAPLATPSPVQTPAAPPPAAAAPPVPAPPTASTPAASTPAASTPAASTPAAPAEADKGVDSAGKVVEVAARPVLRVKNRSSWDDGFVSLKKALATLDAEVKKLGLTTDGPAMAHFVDSDDNGFTFEALVPLKEALAAGVTLSPGLDATLSPAGKAVEFHHEGAYDDIDSAYEAFTAWLDDKNLVSTGKFLEEYRFWPEKSDDPGMKLKITVFLK